MREAVVLEPCFVVHMLVGLACWARCWCLSGALHTAPRWLGVNVQNTKNAACAAPYTCVLA